MTDQDALAARFDGARTRLLAVAYRMLGSSVEAEDAVQEAWFRLSRSDATEVDNLTAWLTTVVARICLDILRSRDSRREDSLDDADQALTAGDHSSVDAEQELLLADSVGSALLVVLETLAPAERLAFVLHDLFAVPFEDIAQILDRSPAAARQLASRARRRVRGQGASSASGVSRGRQREIVDAFLAASRDGNFEALLAVLDPDVVLRGDEAAVRIGAARLLQGAKEVAGSFVGRAAAARVALLDGAPGAVWAAGGRVRVAFQMTIRQGAIAEIMLIADPEHLERLTISVLE